eukprot:scaffold9089_cov20-Prasinocladus_malaysianus.AAC.1
MSSQAQPTLEPSRVALWICLPSITQSLCEFSTWGNHPIAQSKGLDLTTRVCSLSHKYNELRGMYDLKITRQQKAKGREVCVYVKEEVG